MVEKAFGPSMMRVREMSTSSATSALRRSCLPCRCRERRRKRSRPACRAAMPRSRRCRRGTPAEGGIDVNNIVPHTSKAHLSTRLGTGTFAARGRGPDRLEVLGQPGHDRAESDGGDLCHGRPQGPPEGSARRSRRRKPSLCTAARSYGRARPSGGWFPHRRRRSPHVVGHDLEGAVEELPRIEGARVNPLHLLQVAHRNTAATPSTGPAPST